MPLILAVTLFSLLQGLHIHCCSLWSLQASLTSTLGYSKQWLSETFFLTCYDLVYSVGFSDAIEEEINKKSTLSVLTLPLNTESELGCVPLVQQEVILLGSLQVYLSFYNVWQKQANCLQLDFLFVISTYFFPLKLPAVGRKAERVTRKEQDSRSGRQCLWAGTPRRQEAENGR